MKTFSGDQGALDDALLNSDVFGQPPPQSYVVA